MKNLQSLLFIILLTLSCSKALSEVVYSSPSGFSIQSNTSINQPVEAVYQRFLNVAEWWNADHSWFGKGENFSLDAKAGGCFCEIEGNKEVEHMRVVFVLPNKQIKLEGGLGPLRDLGVHGVMSWKFESNKDNTLTKVTHAYVVNGYTPDGLDKLAEVVDSVQTEQLTRLAASFKP